MSNNSTTLTNICIINAQHDEGVLMEVKLLIHSQCEQTWSVSELSILPVSLHAFFTNTLYPILVELKSWMSAVVKKEYVTLTHIMTKASWFVPFNSECLTFPFTYSRKPSPENGIKI